VQQSLPGSDDDKTPTMSVKYSKLQPKDFYFCVGKDPDLCSMVASGMYGEDEVSTTLVVIVPIEFWKDNHYVYDQHLSIENIIPDYMSECMESHFESSKSVEETRNDLLSLGFKELDEFTQFTRSHGLPEQYQEENEYDS
jgi:hypothetical protein